MNSRWSTMLAAAALVAVPVWAHGVERSVTAHCESQLDRMPERAGPEQQAAVRCFYEAAKELDSAEEVSRRLAELARERPDLGWSSFYLASLQWEDPAAADRHLEEAIQRFVRAGDLRGEVLARGNRQQTFFALGRIQEAAREVELAVRVAEKHGDPLTLASARTALARHLLSQSTDLERVRELLTGVIETLPPDAPYPLWRNALANLARAAADVGRPTEARSAFRRLLDRATSEPDPYTEAVAWYGLTRLAGEEMAEAPGTRIRARTVDLASRALAAAESAGHSTIASRAHWVLGVFGDPVTRRDHLERCAELAPTPRDESYCLNALVRFEAERNPAAARQLLERARSLSDAAGDPISRAYVEREEMRIAWASAPAARAIERSWQTLDRIETLRDLQVEGSDVQAGLFSRWSDDYSWLAGRILQESGRGLPLTTAIAEAFRVSERMRARALTDWIRAADAEAAPAGAAAGDFSGLEEVRAALAPAEALLSFQVAPWEDLAGDFGGGSWVLLVTRDAVTVHRLPGRVELRRAVDVFEGLIERRDGAEVGLAARLYEELLAPALEPLPASVERLILVPDDALHRLPFAALRAAADAEPLGTRFELVRVPSATLWLRWRQDPPAAPGRPLLVLADPDSPAAGGAAEAGATVVAEVRDSGQTLGRLPHARREGRAAVRSLGDGLLLVDADASEARLRRLPAREFGLVHFAAHAVTDEARPERSAVLLSAGGGHDGLLRSAEIAGLDLAGRTAVLASCRSASGTVLRGEGVMSLARAFFQAGAHGVVASLWPLRDDESEALFRRFYRHLGRGGSVGQALHRARREAIEAGEPAAAWAGLVVLGDGAAVPLPEGAGQPALGGAATTALLVLVILLVAAGAAAAWRARTSRR